VAGRPDEAEPWLQRAERTGKAEAEPAAGLAARYIRGMLELARGQDADALAAFQAAESLAKRLDAPHRLASSTQAWILLTLIRLVFPS
jgi:LuxR family maltose regulon positive regulatory protein